MNDNFKHNKAFGQNFLTDKNLLSAIVADADITASDTVVEVGAGAGALTEPLAMTGARVISYEIDERLIDNLMTLAIKYPNLTIVHRDILKESPQFTASLGAYKVVANLPYYITTPILFKFIDEGAQSISVMVQKEVAERIVATAGGKEYGVLSVTAQLAGKARITRNVGRHMFTPPPNVDSAVVRLDISGKPNEGVKKLVRAAFSMRRKTLVNCLAAYNKQKVTDALAKLGFKSDVRGERLSPSDYTALYALLKD